MRGEAQAGQRVAGGQARPQWWQRSDVPARWYTSGRSQSGQAWTWPQSRHTTTDAVPRRLMTRIARSPCAASSAASAAASASDSSPRLPAASSARMSTADTLGSVPAGREGSTARRYRPARAWPMLSTDGVALPRTTAAPAIRASSSGRVARLEPRRPVALVGGVVLLVDDHEADVLERRQQRRPRPDDDVRVACPDPAPLVGALALAQPRVEDATRIGRSARRRSTMGVASAISGTSRSAGLPAAREAAIAST